MERRRRVQYPLKRLDQFRYHNPVVPHLDDLRLGREPRDGEARHSGARARGRDDPWCKPALGRGVSGRVLWLFGCLRPCCILGLDGSRGGQLHWRIVWTQRSNLAARINEAMIAQARQRRDDRPASSTAKSSCGTGQSSIGALLPLPGDAEEPK